MIPRVCVGKRKIAWGKRVRGIFVHGDRLVGRSGRIGYGNHVDQNGAGGKPAVAISNGIADRVGSGKIGIGRVINRVVTIDGHRPIGRGGHRDSQRIVIDVAIVGQDVDIGQRNVFVGGSTVSVGDRWILDV